MVEQTLSEQIATHISFIDKLLMCQSALLDCSLQEMAEGLLASIKDNGSVSYLIGTDGRYRTTPLASVIEALYDADMLPDEVLIVMQNRLYECRDTLDRFDKIEDEILKEPEDSAAWSVDEGPSVWTTSKAVFTLIKTGFYKKCSKQQLDGLDRGIKWLVDQAYQQEDGAFAWGFQLDSVKKDCAPSIPMTALALKAIGIACENREDVHKGERQKHGYFKQYINGVKYLIENRHDSDGKCYWEYDGKPSVTATVWAIEAMETLKRDTAIVSQQQLNEIREHALKWVVDDGFPQFCNGAETSDPFFKYQVTKYKSREKTRVFYAFVPHYASFLMKNGVSPFHPKICACIRWLMENKEKNWAINDYNSSEPCSFSAAMALNTIVLWLKDVNVRTYQSIASRIISQKSFEEICSDCGVLKHIPKGQTTEVTCAMQVCEDVPPPEKIDVPPKDKQGKGKFAAIFILIGCISIAGLIYLFRTQVITLLGNQPFLDVMKWILLGILGTLLGLGVKYVVKMIRAYRSKDGGISGTSSGETIDE